MSEKKDKKQPRNKNFQIRAKMPLILRGLAVFGLLAVILGIGIGFYRARSFDPFRLKAEDAKLSKEVTAVVNDYERREIDNGVLKYFIKADKATTFKDEHQELENVFLQVFDVNDEEIFDKISADKAIYIPNKTDKDDFRIYFAGEVDIKTRDGLGIKSEQLFYDKEKEIAESEEYIEFSKGNITGNSYGAIANIQRKTLDLLKDVKINTYATESNSELAKNGIRIAKIDAGRAFFEQEKEKIKLQQGVKINFTPNRNNGEISQPTDIKSDTADAFFTNQEIRKVDLQGNVYVHQKATGNSSDWTKTRANRAIATINKELKKIELFENVQIETTSNGSAPTKIRSQSAVYEKDSDIFELENNVEITTVNDSNPTKINAMRAFYNRRADKIELNGDVEITSSKDSENIKIVATDAVYERGKGKIFLTGNAEVTQGEDLIHGDSITVDLFPNKKLKYVIARGNAFLRQKSPERTTEVNADEVNATFNESQKMRDANAFGDGDVLVIPANTSEYARYALSASQAINLDFREDGTLLDLKTKGRTTIRLNAKNNSPNASDKKITADKIKTTFRKNGNELEKAIATGDAELIIQPRRSSAKNYKTVINAPRFECDFYAKNNAKGCSATNGTKLVRYPTVRGKSKQTLTANRLNSQFSQNTQDIERMDAIGKAKFTEADRNGIANQIVYTVGDDTVRFRGGEPTLWDSDARAKAVEIDWNTKQNTSILRGKVSTTYYSQKNTDGATPFANGDSPVFITANTARFDHDAETGLYTGNARAWQDKNYVRAEKLFIKQKQEQLIAEGKVQSLLYDVNQTTGGKKSKVPVFASAEKMFYTKDKRLIRYEKKVDIRQGKDRIMAGIANIFLDKNNEVTETIAEKNVVFTQPNRRASGSYARYTASNEIITLRGNPASVRDSESGSSSSKEIVVNLKENQFVSNGRTTRNGTGRIRTVYKIKKNKIN